jgi:hypothetical protein
MRGRHCKVVILGLMAMACGAVGKATAAEKQLRVVLHRQHYPVLCLSQTRCLLPQTK